MRIECLDANYNCLGHYNGDLIETLIQVPYGTVWLYLIPEGGVSYCGKS